MQSSIGVARLRANEVESAGFVDTTAFTLAFREIFNRHPDPVLLLDGNGRVLFRNLSATNRLTPSSGFSLRGNRFSILSHDADRAFGAMLSAREYPADDPTWDRVKPRGLRLVRYGLKRDWLLVLHPLLVETTGDRAEHVFFLQAISRNSQGPSIMDILRDCFGATPGEIAAATALMHAGSANGASRRLNRSHETIRSHLKSLYRRCDVNSWSELETLLRSTALFADLGNDATRPNSGPGNTECRFTQRGEVQPAWRVYVAP